EAANIKARLEHLTPSEQAKVRMHIVLEAAAKTDEVLKAKVAKREEEARKKVEDAGTSLEEQVRRIKDIEAIESDSFVPQAFKSSRDDIKRQPRPNQTFIQRRLFRPETVSSGAPLFAASKAAAPTQKPQQATAILRLPSLSPSPPADRRQHVTANLHRPLGHILVGLTQVRTPAAAARTAQTEPVEVKQESESSDHHNVDLPISIVYNDTDSLAHPC
ncbi:hypothetical protein KUCAC02_005002, partial [Chaenocephalus aceratus]